MNAESVASIEEASAELFAALDANGDASMTRDELKAALQRLGLYRDDTSVEQLFLALDIDGDGQITLDEFVKGIGEVAVVAGEGVGVVGESIASVALDYRGRNEGAPDEGRSSAASDDGEISSEDLKRVKALDDTPSDSESDDDDDDDDDEQLTSAARGILSSWQQR